AAFDDVLEMNHAQHVATLGDDERCAAGTGNGVHRVGNNFWEHAAFAVNESFHRLRRAFADAARELAVNGGQIHATHAGLRGERHKLRVRRSDFTSAQTKFFLRQHHDAAAFGRFVGERRELCGVGRRSMVTSGAGMNSVAWRLPSVMVPVLSSSSTSTSPDASTARPLIASTLFCSKRSMPAMPMALNRPPMVVGIRHTSSAISTGTEKTVAE